MKKQATLFRLCLLALATLLLGTAQANNVKITGTTVNDTLVTVNGSWQNGWCLSNHSNDAIYIFYKYRSNGAQQWEHGMQASPGTNTVVTFPNSIVTYTNGALNPVNGAVKLLNKIGGSVHWGNHNNYRGACLFVPPITADGVYDSCQFTFKIKPDLPNALSTYEFKFFAVEMVNIPQGSFYAGDGDTANLRQASDNQPYLITSANWPAANTLKLGDFLLPSVPNTYPNGYKQFYVMKYALSNEAYADFLNMLTTPQQLGVVYGNPTINNSWSGGVPPHPYVMSNADTVDTYWRSGLRIYQAPGGGYEFKCDLNGNGIGNEANDGQTIALMCGYYWQANAYLDWAGLRPLTDLEFEKACRGPLGPVYREYANGTTVIQSTYANTLVNPGTETEADASIVNNPYPNEPRRCGSFARPSGSTRTNTGGTYYGVMDMSSSPNTYTLSVFARISAPSFVLSNGNAGDGYLSPTGGASDASWTKLTYKVTVSAYGSYFGGNASDWIYYNSVRGAISK